MIDFISATVLISPDPELVSYFLYLFFIFYCCLTLRLFLPRQIVPTFTLLRDNLLGEFENLIKLYQNMKKYFKCAQNKS